MCEVIYVFSQFLFGICDQFLMRQAGLGQSWGCNSNRAVCSLTHSEPSLVTLNLLNLAIPPCMCFSKHDVHWKCIGFCQLKKKNIPGSLCCFVWFLFKQITSSKMCNPCIIHLDNLSLFEYGELCSFFCFCTMCSILCGYDLFNLSLFVGI